MSSFQKMAEQIKETKENELRNKDYKSGEKEEPYKMEIVPRSTFLICMIHAMGLWGIHLIHTEVIKSEVKSIMVAQGFLGVLGITVGAHRLWAHKTFKAKRPLELFLLFMNTTMAQNSVIEWSRDHRVHHKYSETDADPHNAKRGFFFAHMGWLMVRKHPNVKRKGASVDMSDLEADPFLMFQHRYYTPLVVLLAFILPTLQIYYLVPGVSIWHCWLCTAAKYIFTLHGTWLVNSAAHLWGHRPYDKSMNPAENMIVSLVSGGEGWHNFHHAFPGDYKASEFGLYVFSPATLFIDLAALVGLVYDRKTTPPDVVEQRMKRTGDGTQYRH